MCGRCSSQPVCGKAGVLAIAVTDMLFDAFVLGATVWQVASISHVYGQDEVEQPTGMVVAMTVAVIGSSIDLLFSVMLIHGVIKESVRQIMAWWWWSVCLLGLRTVRVVWEVVYDVKNNRLVGGPIFVVAIIIAVLLFFLVAVKSYVNYLRRKAFLPSVLHNEDDEENVFDRT